MKLLQPDLSADRLTDIDLNYWYDQGIRCILIDLDNTIALWRHTDLTEDALAMITRARSMGMTAALFTNAPDKRAREAAWNAGISYYANARKPLPFRYRRAIAELSFSREEVMTIGDQVFTDVLGGNLVGCVTVLTSPLSVVEFSGTRLLRYLERIFAGRKLAGRPN